MYDRRSCNKSAERIQTLLNGKSLEAALASKGHLPVRHLAAIAVDKDVPAGENVAAAPRVAQSLGSGYIITQLRLHHPLNPQRFAAGMTDDIVHHPRLEKLQLMQWL